MWGWWHACRPKTLVAALAPVMLGSACAAAAGGFAWRSAGLASFFALLVQVTCNFANDRGDFERGADTPLRTGPERMVATGRITPAAMRRATVIAAAAAFVVGLPLAFWGGWWLVGVGVLCIAACLAYTDGPFPLAYNGLGDIFVLIFFGFVAVLFTARVQCGAFPATAWAAGLSCGLLAVNILVVNNVRDMETDRLAGKRTTVVRFGRKFAVRFYAANMAVSLLVPVGLWMAGLAGALVLLSLAVAPLATALVWGFFRVREPAGYNVFLGKTAAFLLGHSALFAVGLAWGR
ncbi:MAG: 1,4-dihydroxy-2-naphthoate octaprenyltransferase [Puniceicoccales bacterium]|nr:1,4-dihydroxy-2-naphthoate octaprenyltransferase [Puniceicoccales bacterium]